MMDEEKAKAVKDALNLMTSYERRALLAEIYESGYIARYDVRRLIGIDEDAFDEKASDYRDEGLEFRLITLSGNLLADKVEQIRKEQGEY